MSRFSGIINIVVLQLAGIASKLIKLIPMAYNVRTFNLNPSACILKATVQAKVVVVAMNLARIVVRLNIIYACANRTHKVVLSK